MVRPWLHPATADHCGGASPRIPADVTPYRRDLFDDEMLGRCEEITRNVRNDFGADLIEFNGEDDHAHLLVHHPPKIALSSLVDSLRGVSSRYLRTEFTARVDRATLHGRFWSGSCVAGSCGGAPLRTVKDRIEDQKQPD